MIRPGSDVRTNWDKYPNVECFRSNWEYRTYPAKTVGTTPY